MPKKQKKAAGGGGRTEEEKLVYLQQRAQAEEELARKKEEILALFLKDKLQKEQRNSALNALKLSDSWRTILRQSRAAELRGNVSVLSRRFERELDGLDGTVKSLERELHEAERQAAQVNRLHLRSLERLCAQQDKWLRFVQLQWDKSLQQLSAGVRSERKQMLANSEQLRADLDDAAFMLERRYEETMREIHRVYRDSVTAFEKSPETTRVDLLREDKETLQEKSGRNQQDRQVMEHRTTQLNDKLAKNQVSSQKAESLEKKLQNQKDDIVQTKKLIKSSQTDQEALERDLSGARKEVTRKTRGLRDQLTRAQAAARRRLTDITIHSSNAIKRLQEVINKGEKVLRIADMCRKLALEQENAFTASSAPTVLEEEPEKEPAQFPELQQVMRSVNAARLRHEALKKQKSDLSRENQQLRLLLRRHLDAMTVSDGGLDGAQPLLTVYQVPAEPGRRHAVTEAAHAARRSLTD
ncbi:dynein regulatory complex subunit 2 [Betta splendens]|uniref:Dynein regulatory complex subunit 2 n=1 Tax=Betta splendens TaxID=158456 RepID=A0A6P7LJ96_BETSP|nr:dynein regulatory complex subunit 2 [Betta splendens]